MPREHTDPAGGSGHGRARPRGGYEVPAGIPLVVPVITIPYLITAAETSLTQIATGLLAAIAISRRHAE